MRRTGPPPGDGPFILHLTAELLRNTVSTIAHKIKSFHTLNCLCIVFTENNGTKVEICAVNMKNDAFEFYLSVARLRHKDAILKAIVTIIIKQINYYSFDLVIRFTVGHCH